MSASEVNITYGVSSLRETIKLIQDEINKMELEGIKESFDIELRIMEVFPEFYQSHPFLIKKLCKREDISMLYTMLSNLQQVEDGNKTLSNVELHLGNQLAKQYLYPVVKK